MAGKYLTRLALIVSLSLSLSALPAVAKPAAAPTTRYVVKSGDTLERIAARNAISLDLIARENGLKSPYRLLAGQVLKLPATRYHVVRNGETGLEIAIKYGVSWPQILAANDLKDSALLRAGQRLALPPGAAISAPKIEKPAPAVTKPVATPAPRIAAATPKPSPASPTSPKATTQLRAPLAKPTPATSAPAQTQPKPSATAITSPPATAPATTAPAPAQRLVLDLDDIIAESPTARQPTGPVPGTAAPATATAQPAPQAAIIVPRPASPAAEAVAALARFEGDLAWPVRGRILREFGNLGNGRRNDGINIAAPYGTPVYAAADGVVAYLGTDVAIYGGLVLIRHADNWITAYGHIERLQVKRGQAVKKGQLIAYVAQGTLEEQDQLHFQIRQGRTPVDPISQLPARN